MEGYKGGRGKIGCERRVRKRGKGGKGRILSYLWQVSTQINDWQFSMLVVNVLKSPACLTIVCFHNHD